MVTLLVFSAVVDAGEVSASGERVKDACVSMTCQGLGSKSGFACNIRDRKSTGEILKHVHSDLSRGTECTITACPITSGNARAACSMTGVTATGSASAGTSGVGVGVSIGLIETVFFGNCDVWCGNTEPFYKTRSGDKMIKRGNFDPDKLKTYVQCAQLRGESNSQSRCRVSSSWDPAYYLGPEEALENFDPTPLN